MRKKASVRRTYYRLFFTFIVLPLVLVTIVGAGVLYHKLLQDAREKVVLQQEAVSDVLTKEVSKASRQLAHFLLYSDNGVLSMVNELPENASRRNTTEAQLEHMFEYYRMTDRQLAALHLYLADGTSYQLYTGLAVPQSYITSQPWYLDAKQNDKRVFIGTAPIGTLLSSKSRRGDVLLTAAMSVRPNIGDTTALEVACLYFETDIEKMLKSYDGTSGATYMFLTLDDQILAGNSAMAPLAQEFLAQPDMAHGKMDWCMITDVPSTGLHIVTIVDNFLLMAGYYKVIFLCLAIAIVVMGLYVVFSLLFLKRILLPLNSLGEGMRHLQQGDFSHRLTPNGHLELQQLMQSYNDTGARMQALIEENRCREAEKYEEEMKALQSEINPHFLLNTVNTIRFMADMVKYDSIRDMATNLMEILRCVLRNKTKHYTLAEEAKLLGSYMNIMEIRYCNSFSFRCDFSPDSLACQMPRLLLQPLVENAVFHGVANQEGGEVVLTSEIKSGTLEITVCDNGSGMTQQALADCLSGAADSSIGLANVKRRIELQYGSGYGLQAESAPGEGTRMTITLPVVQEEKSEC